MNQIESKLCLVNWNVGLLPDIIALLAPY